MKLYYSDTSPYARKVLVCALEHGLTDRLEMHRVNPLKDAELVSSVSPLGKVPVLVGPEGELVVDSPVICAYLDHLAASNGGISLEENVEDWGREATLHALADGVMDAAFLLVMESMRPQSQQSTYWTNRWQSAIDRTLNCLEQAWFDHGVPAPFTIGCIALGCALGYLDFRLDHLGWRAQRPVLSEWFIQIGGRDSFKETTPPPS